jgi:hypothetical protein
MAEVEWEKSVLTEVDISGTELSSEAIASMLTRLTNLRWLKAAFLENFNDDVMQRWLDSGAMSNVVYLDLDTCDQLREKMINDLLNRYGAQFIALNLAGHHRLTENFWMHGLRYLPNIRYVFRK